MTKREAFLYNLDHHGGAFNNGLTIALIGKFRKHGFKVLPRSTTRTMRHPNGRLLVVDERDTTTGVATLRYAGSKKPLITIDIRALRALGAGKKAAARRVAIDKGLEDVVAQVLALGAKVKMAA